MVSNAQVIHNTGFLIVTVSSRGLNTNFADSSRKRVSQRSREMKASPDFQRDFAEVNAEAAAAQNSLQVISQSFITRMAPACHVLVTSKCRISPKI